MREGLTMNELAEKNALLVSEVSGLQQKLDALAAENAYLKDSVTMHAAGFAECSVCGHEEPCETHDIVWMAKKTPATDAYLNSVRSDAVVEASAHLADMAEGKSPHTAELIKSCGRAVFAYAAQIRSGTHGTADKAG